MRQFTDLQLLDMDPLIEMIQSENIRQLEKWGIQTHSGPVWSTILQEEVGEVAKSILECTFGTGSHKQVAEEAIQIATVALKIAEMYDAETEK